MDPKKVPKKDTTQSIPFGNTTAYRFPRQDAGTPSTSPYGKMEDTYAQKIYSR